MIMHDMNDYDKQLQKLPPRHEVIEYKIAEEKTKEFQNLISSNNILSMIEMRMVDNPIGQEYLSKAIDSKIREGNNCGFVSLYEHAISLMMEDIALYSSDDIARSDKIFRLENDNKLLKAENERLKHDNEYLKKTCETVHRCLYDVVKGDK